MAPNLRIASPNQCNDVDVKDLLLNNSDLKNCDQINKDDDIVDSNKSSKAVCKYKLEIVWTNVVIFAMLHLYAIFGIYLSITRAKWQTNVAAFLLYLCAGLGITAGAHRLWSHRSYKAKFPLRLLLCFFNCIAFQNHIYEWCRDHRVHHKYSETDADPHNATRGFFFAHIGWLLCKKHPEVKRKGATVDCNDVLMDPIVRFQKRYYLPLTIFCCFILPILLGCLWGESIINSFCIMALLRYCFTLHMTWLVNSAAHMFGNRPYDVNINPRENYFTVFGAIGEGFHNYHHTFPFDYSTSEYGIKWNLTTCFINLMYTLGQAYDLKRVSKAIVEQRKLRTGEGVNFHSS